MPFRPGVKDSPLDYCLGWVPAFAGTTKEMGYSLFALAPQPLLERIAHGLVPRALHSGHERTVELEVIDALRLEKAPDVLSCDNFRRSALHGDGIGMPIERFHFVSRLSFVL